MHSGSPPLAFPSAKTVMAGRRRRQLEQRDYAGRDVYIAGRAVWWRDSLGRESVPHLCAPEEDPEIVAEEKRAELDAHDPIEDHQFTPPPLSGRVRDYLRLLCVAALVGI